MALIICPGCTQTVSNSYVCPYCTSSVQVQLLGSRGTDDCIQAILAVLTGPAKCSSITALFGQREPSDNCEAVCFAVWDWIGAEITIIRDGFGTHPGGRVGLGHVFYLIDMYQIPLFQKQIDVDFFNRVIRGRITVEDLEQLRIHDHTGKHLIRNYPYALRQNKLVVWRHVRHPSIPYRMIEPEFYEEVRELVDKPADAVFKVVRRLEVIIREVCQLPPHVTGELLIHAALREKKPLELRGETAHEVEAWIHLFQGVIGALKEPYHRSEQKITEEEALEQIITVNMLLRKLKKDYPKKFLKKTE